MDWPLNPYLDAWLRTDEGQAYLDRHGILEHWRERRARLGDIEIVSTPDVPPNTLILVSQDSSVIVTNVAPAPTTDAWDF